MQDWKHDGVPLQTRELAQNSHAAILGSIDREFHSIEAFNRGTRMILREPAPRIPIGNINIIAIAAEFPTVTGSWRITFYENTVPVNGNW